jgi:Na+/glutamate symporter
VIFLNICVNGNENNFTSNDVYYASPIPLIEETYLKSRYLNISEKKNLFLVCLNVINIIPLIFACIYLPCGDSDKDCIPLEEYLFSVITHIFVFILSLLLFIINLFYMKHVNRKKLKRISYIHGILLFMATSLISMDIWEISKFALDAFAKFILYPLSPDALIDILGIVIFSRHLLIFFLHFIFLLALYKILRENP